MELRPTLGTLVLLAILAPLLAPAVTWLVQFISSLMSTGLGTVVTMRVDVKVNESVGGVRTARTVIEQLRGLAAAIRDVLSNPTALLGLIAAAMLWLAIEAGEKGW